MKKVFLFLLFILLPISVTAEEVLLKDVTIQNGELSLPFDAYNTEYTVTLGEMEDHLDLNYNVNEGIIVAVNNNYDLENDSVVTLTVSKENSHLDYHFHILKEEKESTPIFKEIVVEKENFMYKYKQYIIPTICFLCSFILYKILFRKHKKKII